MDSVAYHTELEDAPPRPPATMAEVRARFGTMAAGPDRLRLCAVVGGEVVGLVEARLQRDSSGNVSVYVDELAVAESHRGQGIGTRLMAEAEHWAQQSDAAWIALDTMSNNAGARNLYEAHLGYRPVGVILRKNLRSYPPG